MSVWGGKGREWRLRGKQVEIGARKLVDKYFWMRDDERKSVRVLKHLELEVSWMHFPTRIVDN